MSSSTIVEQTEEFYGRLTIASGPIEGAYGPYWRVTVTSEGDTGQSVAAILADRVWSRAGLPILEAADVRVKVRRNAADRWNVVEVDVGPERLEGIRATVIAVEQTNGAQQDGQEGKGVSYQLRLEGKDGACYKARLTQKMLGFFNIKTLPADFTLVSSDWRRERWGWQLVQIGEPTLLSFFTAAEDGLPEATGNLSINWRYTDEADHLMANFETAIPGLTLQCRVRTYLLRRAGLREFRADAPIVGRLWLRQGRWRLAEWAEPRVLLGGGNSDLFAVHTRFFRREEVRIVDGDESRVIVVCWLAVEDPRFAEGGFATLDQERLIAIGEGDLQPGARIVCNLNRGQQGDWYGDRIHRIADCPLAPAG